MTADEPRYVDIEIHNLANGKSIDCKALIDTGASSCCLPRSIALALDLRPNSMALISSVMGTLAVPQYLVRLVIGKETFRCTVVEIADPTPALIGWDVIQQSSLLTTISTKIPGHIVHFLTAIPTLKRQMVLVLGQDTTHIDRLNSHGYIGIIVKEQSDIDIQSIEEKVNMLASLCRFVICDNSFPSGHIDELKICALNRFVTAVIQEKGKGATWMQSDYRFDFSFIEVFEYPDVGNIRRTVDKAVEWAERKLTDRKSFFDKLYTWRTP